MATTISTTTSNCSYFFNLRSNSVEPREARSSSSSGHGSQLAAAGSGCGKLDGVVMWFVNGVSTAFFASLDRCSCIRIGTVDDGEDANDLPLIHSDGNVRSGYRTTSRRRGRGEKGAAFIQE
ncbi:hypothetical protein HRI_001407600 [Hibiscus trionum]|uniref:Uncharacterized protein n=1 Tax=Hibiscus trionum TaxID=183268 RepID=A0A9W7HH67_HIBTR|nr:hypothetical protein HRI_001407600 [Hibiscus trionum]